MKNKWKTYLVFLEYVIIFYRNVDDHIKQVEEILMILRDADVTLEISKCHILQRRFEYLGHMVQHGQLKRVKTNVDSLRQAQPPTDKMQRRSFLGLYNVYGRFIDNFMGTAHLLNKFLKKGTLD